MKIIIVIDEGLLLICLVVAYLISNYEEINGVLFVISQCLDINNTLFEFQRLGFDTHNSFLNIQKQLCNVTKNVYNRKSSFGKAQTELGISINRGERGGSVVECRTPEREVRGSRPTAAVLCP